MRKTDKKLDNQIRQALTEVCERVLKEVTGFEWLTHQVKYSNFPQSLQVTCVFKTNAQLAEFQNSEQNGRINQLIQASLKDVGINLPKIAKHIHYDTEENCDLLHQGNWPQRLAQYS